MNKNCLIWFVAIFFLAIIGPIYAPQSGNIPRIGFLATGFDSTTIAAFREGLRDLGYVEEKNISIQFRDPEGHIGRIPDFVAELVQLNVDILVVGPLLAIRAAKEATKTIPIVMVTTVDPVEAGLVNSFARPGGNITGLATLTRQLGGKRLELAKEVLPRLSRIGVLSDSESPMAAIASKEYASAARALGLQVQSLEMRGTNPDLSEIFGSATKSHIGALVPISNPLISSHRKQIVELAIKNRIPTVCDLRSYVETGCLMSYATDRAAQYKRAAVYVDKILKRN
jgi:putative ABC transport system substrate-binding protein